MKFYTPAAIKRPVRLSKETRQWAWDSLHGKYGDEAMRFNHVDLDGIEGFDDMNDLQRYDAIVRTIAEKAPIRYCEEERISGSATLGMAVWHLMPAVRSGYDSFWSISHLTIEYAKTLRIGLDGYDAEIVERLKDPSLTQKQTDFLNSLRYTIESFRIWHARYLELLKDKKPECYENLLQVPFGPALNFRQAVQSMWMVFAFVRLCGNWPGFGRIDEILGPYLKKDLADGTITVDEAREVLASFFIKGCEWILSDTPLGSGDAQHYQNIILAGIDCDGHEVTNEVTYLVLDVVEELPISDFPISVRVNSKTPAKLLRKMARVIRHGGGIVAVYNEELVLRAMVKEGYDIREARKFGNDGCWEVQVPGSTCFTYHPFDSLQVLNAALGFDGNKDVPDCKNIDEVFDLFHAELAETVKGIYERRVKSLFGKVDGKWCGVTPYIQSSVISLFENGCIENAASYFDLGPIYTTRSPHIGGAPDVGNSLYAISKIVFEEKKLTLPELGEILKNNWEDHEELRQYVRNKLTYYGNDCDESDAYTSRVLNDFADIVHALAEKDHPCKLIPGVSTFGRQLEWRPMRCAVAFGFKKGDILSGNDSPTPGTDFSGATAIVKSYCKADLEKQSCGAALDIKLYPDTLNGNDGINALVSLIRGFVELDGYFMQMDVIDKAILLAARDNPQEYKTLSVRVSGWNARFVTLAREWQDMIIERTGQNV